MDRPNPINIRIGAISRFFHPGYSWCFRCRTNWYDVEPHTTMYWDHGTGSSGMFPLCEWCWRELTPAKRLPYYRELWEQWQREGTGEPDSFWPLVVQAVMAGR